MYYLKTERDNFFGCEMGEESKSQSKRKKRPRSLLWRSVALRFVCVCDLTVDRRDTVSSPFPKQLESEGSKRAYHTLISSLDGIPDMMEVSLGLFAVQSC